MKKKFLYLLLLPGLTLIVLFLFVPMFSIILDTFRGDSGMTLSRYVAFFRDKYYVNIYLRTLKLSLISTGISVVFGFPTAYYISKTKKSLKSIYTILAVFPLLTSPVVRSFSWMVVLGRHGIINNALLALHIINEPLSLLYNEISVVVGFVNLFLPLMIMSLIGVMENIDGGLVEAAESLGASKFMSFVKVIFPLSLPGLIVGSVLVFTGCFTAYTTPQLLGGDKTQVLATLIYQQAMSLSNWNTAAVISTVMIVTTIIVSTVINKMAAGLQVKDGI
jgi:putative spermidine/putrescine transport system permease protein